MQFSMKSLITTALLLYSFNSWAATTVVKKPSEPTPSRMNKQLMVIGQEVIRDQWPGTLTLVNIPENRQMALPGQCVSLSVLAAGDERDSLLSASTFNFKIEFNGKTQTYHGLQPAQIKRIKPEGGDFVMQILSAAKVDTSKESGLPAGLSMVSLATFDLTWCVPQEAKDGKATIQGSAILPKGETLQFDEVNLPISSFAAAVGQGTFKNNEELSKWIMTYYRQPNPARTLAACRLVVDDKIAFTINLRTFLVEVLRSSPECAKDLQARLPGETSVVQGYAIHLLQKAGYDVTKSIEQLPEKEQAFQKEFQRRVPPLPDPYDLRIDPEHFDTPQRMDALWSCFLATGKPKPVRAVAGLLMWREDYKAVKEARKTPQKSKSLTVELGRGVCYQAAGWSLGSFVKNHGLVADFVEAWKQDPKTPKVLKEELEGLFGNEAFKR